MDEPLNTIVGEYLSSVEFVMDYVQLRFCGPCLTINAPIVVTVMGTRFKQGSPCYRGRLCERIGQTVQRAFTVDDEKIIIEFRDHSEVEISLKPEERVSPEAAEFVDREKQIHVIW